MWNLKYVTNVLTYKAETESQTENKFLITKGKTGWEGMN